MTLYVLAATTVVLFLLLVGLSLLLFAREWVRQRGTERFSRRLERHAALVERLRSTSHDAFEGAFRQLSAIDSPRIREALLDLANEDAPAATTLHLVRAYEDLAIVEGYIEAVEHLPRWEARAAAAERLGRIGSARAVPALLRVIRNVKDEDEDVRGAALRALGRIRDPRALPALIEALGATEASLPPRIAEIIVMYGTDAVAPLIVELRNLDSHARRMWAAEILGWLGDPEASVSLMESLGDVNPEVRAKAAGAIGKIREERAVDRLLEMLLSDPIPFVRTRVARALGEIGHPRVIDHLIHVLKDPEWWVRVRTIEALEQIGEGSSEALLVALEDDDEEVRRRAAVVLERLGYVRRGMTVLETEGFRPDVYRVLLDIGRAGVTEVLHDGLRTAEGDGLKHLVRLAGSVGDPGAGPLLLTVLAEIDDWSLRSRVLQALGRIGYQEAIPAVLGCLRDPADWVRRSSVRALGQLGAEEHTGDLIVLLEDPVAATRQAVCRVLSPLAVEGIDEVVEALLTDPDSGVRAEALKAVAKREMRSSEPKACELLADASAEVRREAAKALAVVGGEASVDALLRASSGAPEDMVEAVIDAVVHCHQGSFASLLEAAPEGFSREQVLVLLEAAAQGRGSGRATFVSSYLKATDPEHRRGAAYALRGFEPNEISDLLVGPMQDPDDSVRVAAVTVAAFSADEQLLRSSEGLSVDPHEQVRFHVALALGLSQDGRLRETLLTLVQDQDASVRAGAAMALALQSEPTLIPIIRDLSLDEEVSERAKEIFVRGAADPLVAKVVEDALDQNMMETRLFLGESRFALEQDLVQYAREALTAAERVRALEIGKVVATGQSYPTVLAILKNDPAPEVRASALDLLLTLRQDAEMARVAGTSLVDPHPKLRVRAARALGGLDFPEAMEALVHALDTQDRELREAVTSSLSLHMRRDEELAEKLMQEIPSTYTRKLGMVWLLGKSRRKGAMGVLLRYLADDDGNVRAAAVGALAKYRPGIVARHLKGSLSDPNGKVRAATVNALSRARTPELEAAMESMLSDPDSFVRQRAAIALFRMGSETVSQRIRTIDKEPAELRPVWAAIGLVGGELLPVDLAAYPEAATFVQELFPLKEAEADIREARDPHRRLIAFRVLQSESAAVGESAAEVLIKDPNTALREAAGYALAQREGV